MFYMQMPVVFRKLLGGENVQILTIWYLLCILIIFTQLFLKIKHTIFLTCQRLWILSFLSVTQIVQERRIHRNFDFNFFLKNYFCIIFLGILTPGVLKWKRGRIQECKSIYGLSLCQNIGSNLSQSQKVHAFATNK